MFIGFQMKHHTYIYELYLANPSRSLYGYVEELYRYFSLDIITDTIQNWFKTIGPFKRIRQVAYRYSSERSTYIAYRILKHYLAFILSIDYHTRLVFADDEPMKEINM